MKNPGTPPTEETARKVIRATDLINTQLQLGAAGRADLVLVPINTQLQLGVGEQGAHAATRKHVTEVRC